MIRAVLLAAALTGCASLSTGQRTTLDGCEWARPIVVPAAVDVVTRDLSAEDFEVRQFRVDLATHNKNAVENCGPALGR